MKIDKDLEKIVGPFPQEAKVSLFIVSAKSSRLKKLDLGTLSLEEAGKLHQCGQEHRFVAVVEIGGKIFAHTHNTFAGQELSLDGKRVTVKALSDEDYEKLAAVGAAFEDYLNLEDGKVETEEALERYLPSQAIGQFLAKNALLSDQMQMDYLIARMKNLPSQVILKCLKLFNEARREDEKRSQEDDKRFQIKKREIEKDILRGEIRQEGIKTQERKHTRIQEDI